MFLTLTLNKNSYQSQGLNRLKDSNIFITPKGRDFIQSYKIKDSSNINLEIDENFLEKVNTTCYLVKLLNHNGKEIKPIIENIYTRPFLKNPKYTPPKRILDLIAEIPLGSKVNLEEIEKTKKEFNLLDKKVFLTTDYEGDICLSYETEESLDSINSRLIDYDTQYNKQIEEIEKLNLEIKKKNKKIKDLIKNYHLFF